MIMDYDNNQDDSLMDSIDSHREISTEEEGDVTDAPYDTGCEWKGKLSSLDNHINQCLYKPYSNCPFGCDNTKKKQITKTHFEQNKHNI